VTEPEWPSLPTDTPTTLDLSKIEYEARFGDVRDQLKELREQVRKQSDRQAELDKITHQAEADDRNADRQDVRENVRKLEERDYEREKADWAAELELYKLIYEGRSKLAAEAINRGTAGAEFIRNAAAGIVTIYSTVLGVAFAVASNRVAPARGLVPAFFLGMSLALAAAYVAFLSRAPDIKGLTPSDSLRVLQERRLNKFIAWATGLALHRAWALHASVVALALGAATLPLPFASVPSGLVVAIVVTGIALMVVIPVATYQPPEET
jgi:VIT1/CCC1 family predicted Fe2+/Mn2+ transporter